MKLLLLSSNEIGDLTSGQGIILSYSVRHLISRLDLEIGLGIFRASSLFSAAIVPEKYKPYLPTLVPLFELPGRPIDRVLRLRSLFGLPLDRQAKNFLREVSEISQRFDLAIWFGSAYDPISVHLPRHCHCPIVFHVNDSISLYHRRRINNRLGQVLTHLVQHRERQLLAVDYRMTVYVSKEDYEVGVKLSPPQLANRVACLPIGVDVQYFQPGLRAKSTQNKIVLLFTGNMFYQPNIDAALYLIREVMPRIKSAVELRIVGRDPVPEILNAAKLDSRVIVTGTVPNMLAEYQSSDIFIAPMISAAGIKIKILEALACGLPVVTTPMCVEAFPSPSSSVVAGATAEEMVGLVEHLISDANLRKRLGQDARTFVEKGWSWEQRTDKLIELCRNVINEINPA